MLNRKLRASHVSMTPMPTVTLCANNVETAVSSESGGPGNLSNRKDYHCHRDNHKGVHTSSDLPMQGERGV